MSIQIDTMRVKQYSSNVFHLAQQKGSRLRALVRNESQQGKAAFYDRIGAVTAVKKTSRHADTPRLDTPHSRRMVTLSDYEYADLVDKEDKLRLIHDPTNDYAVAAINALGRAMDDVIITAALGNAYGGEEGTTSIALANANKLAAFDGSTTTGVNLNVKTLIAAKMYFEENEVDDPNLFIAVSASQLQSLLNETQITSQDFNIVKALVQGSVDFYMGFKFVRTQRLPQAAANVTYDETDGSVGAGGGTITAANSRRCFAWAQSGMLLAIAQDIMVDISKRVDKSMSMQVYASLGLGATRLEEEKVLEIICSE